MLFQFVYQMMMLKLAQNRDCTERLLFKDFVYQINKQPKTLSSSSWNNCKMIQISEQWHNTFNKFQSSGKKCFTCVLHQCWSPLSTFSFSNGLQSHFCISQCFSFSLCSVLLEDGHTCKEKNITLYHQLVKKQHMCNQKTIEILLLELVLHGLLDSFICASCAAAGRIFPLELLSWNLHLNSFQAISQSLLFHWCHMLPPCSFSHTGLQLLYSYIVSDKLNLKKIPS